MNLSASLGLQIRRTWPTTLFQRQWPELTAEGDAIVQRLRELQSAQSEQIASGVAVAAKSSEGLFEGDFDLLDDSHPGIQRLRRFILESVRLAVSQANGGSVHPRLIDVEIPDSWFHITNGGGFHDAHTHHACSWCGIFCLRAGDSAGKPGGGAGNGVNRFYSPLSQGGGFRDYGNAYLSGDQVDIVPKDGQLTLFPSYLLHSALPYQGENDRIVIAFNTRSYARTDEAS